MSWISLVLELFLFFPILCRCHLTGALATACGDDAIRVFEEEPLSDPHQPTFSLTAHMAQAHSQDVNCVAWNPKVPGLLASCSDDGEMAFWKYQRPELCWRHCYFREGVGWGSQGLDPPEKATKHPTNWFNCAVVVSILSEELQVPQVRITVWKGNTGFNWEGIWLFFGMDLGYCQGRMHWSWISKVGPKWTLESFLIPSMMASGSEMMGFKCWFLLNQSPKRCPVGCYEGKGAAILTSIKWIKYNICWCSSWLPLLNYSFPNLCSSG